ncbi:MAG: hypothetical protein KZQ83_00555 [gamma proteobacterium symbiont of Taylorina sp.]|nr:hypothetical protein [gamma proteobacterium symbiont of Taylorina sp.]
MAVNLETAKEYGLSVYYYESGQHYKITRYGQDVTECRDILELSDTTMAIANFIDVGKEHHKII